jgi:predicted ArsR family transcriptional regulator
VTSQLHFNSLQAWDVAQRAIPETQQRIYDALANFGPMTCEEVAVKLSKLPHQISGRFKVMEAAGLIEKHGTKKNQRGCSADVWSAM